MYILTSEEMARIDRRAVEELGIPSIVLMENAALAVVEVIESHFPTADNVAVFCGPGKNGGDGLAVARHLHNRGIVTHLFLIGEKSKLTGDAETNLRICELMEIPIEEVGDEASLLEALAHAAASDLIVDAIFGTGLNRAPSGLYADVILSFPELRLPVVAVDLPSGLDGSSSEVREPVVAADVTVTFALPKIPHIFSPAADYCGEVVVADISIPRAAVDAENPRLSLITREDVLPRIGSRASETHKGTFGHVALVSGSAGRSGAAIMAARAAVRGGAGLVTVVTDPDTARLVDTVSIESMSLPIILEPRSIETILRFLDRKAALLVGPGLPDEENSYEFIRSLLDKVELPVVVDATAINAYAGQVDAINPARRPRVLTPHPGELARLLDTSTAEIQAGRRAWARRAASASGCVVVLKGHQTLIASPDGRLAVNPTGNPGMATGGVGDVLSGLLLALIGHDSGDLFEAACAAVYLHGTAGDRVRERSSDIGIAALDLAEALPEAVEHLRSE